MGFMDRFRARKTEAHSSSAEASSFDDLHPSLPPLARGLDEDHSMESTVVFRGGAPATMADTSIITESTPTEAGAHAFAETTSDAEVARAVAARRLPLIGHWPAARQQRTLLMLLMLGALLLAVSLFMGISAANRAAQQIAATGQAQMQSQRLAKSVSQAVVGVAPAFEEVRDSAKVLAANVHGLQVGNDAAPAVSGDAAAAVLPLVPLVERAEKSAAAVLDQEKSLVEVSKTLRSISQQSDQMLEGVQALAAARPNATPAETAVLGQMTMLTQRIAKSANEFVTLQGVSPEAVFMLGKDMNRFRDLLDGLLNGSDELRVGAAHDPATVESLKQLVLQHTTIGNQTNAILSKLQNLVSTRQAQSVIVADSEPLRKGLQTLQQQLSADSGFGPGHIAMIVLGTLAMLAGAAGLLRLFVVEQSSRAAVADAQRHEAERQEHEARRVNDANQAAILRLMNELQTVAEGDLTQQATVTEDITGAIADSVNYTVEELRTLVSQVQNTVSHVAGTTQQVEQTSTELLAASTEQLREIRDTGESVLQMAGRINDVSSQAQRTAEVARQSLTVAGTGLTAVQNTIGGMNSIRDQIQDTSKRIKRLGESSQEIGEITELISDITEQTNVLALNAAIQAASAGDAGRGFSVVAEEVQRLAERSADATRQISALVRAIQTDTQDAVAAMERSTQGVVEGAKLSDAAGSALGDIDRVTRELAALIERISSQASQEAKSANVVASNIQHIFAVTEQTSEGTQSTSHMVRELSKAADDLRASVARFKVS